MIVVSCFLAFSKSPTLFSDPADSNLFSVVWKHFISSLKWKDCLWAFIAIYRNWDDALVLTDNPGLCSADDSF